MPGRHLGEKVIHAESRRVGHAAAETTRAKTTAFAAPRYDSAMPAVSASDAQKAMNRNAATKVSLKLVKHEGRQFAASGFQIGQERRPMFLYRSIKQSRFGSMARVRACTRGCGSVTDRCWSRRKHQQQLSATAPYWLLTTRGNLCTLGPGEGLVCASWPTARRCGCGSPCGGGQRTANKLSLLDATEDAEYLLPGRRRNRTVRSTVQ